MPDPIPAAADLFQQTYGELRALAARMLADERAGHTLQPTALVHEAFFRLSGGDLAAAPFETRRRFLAAAANAMRQVLVDHARRKASLKRGGGLRRGDVDPGALPAPERARAA